MLLRTPQMSDYPDWAELRAASREFLTPWEPLWADRRALPRLVPPPRPPLSARSPRGHGLCAVHLRRIERLAGRWPHALQCRRGVTQSCTLGYWVGADYAKQGYMTAAVRAVIPFVFDSLELHRLEAACLPTNAASIKLLERTGFTREGMARRYLRDQRRLAGPSALRAA